MNNNLRNFALWAIIILLLLALFTLFQNPGMRSSTPDISFSQFLSEVDQGRVRDVLIAGQEIRGTFVNGGRFESYGPTDQAWIQRVQGKGVSVTIRPQSNDVPWFVSLTVSWLPFLALIGVWIFLSRRMQGAFGNIPASSDILQSPSQIEGIKRRLDDMQKQIDELSRKDKS